jgi:hypothetical protein
MLNILSRRVVICLLVAVLLVTIAERYPLVEHERYQADSYYIHMLSGSIVERGYAAWTFTPLSYFGYYPLSYPSGAPFLVGEFSELAGTSVELSILLIGMLVGMLLVIATFCLAREFLRRTQYALVAALCASLAPRFVDTTYWVGSARGLFVVFLVLFIFLAFRANSTKRTSLNLIAGLMLFGCLATHHMALLLIMFGIAFILSVLGSQHLRLINETSRRRRVTQFYISIGVFVAIGTALFVGLLGGSGESTFGESGVLTFEPRIVSTILSLCITYTHQIGLILPFAVVGIIMAFRATHLQPRVLFPLALLVSMSPLFGNPVYVATVLPPVVAVFGASWLESLKKSDRRQAIRFFLALILVCFTISLPWVSIARWNNVQYIGGDTVAVGDQVFNDGAYLMYNDAGQPFVSNVDVQTLRLEAISGANHLGPGVPSVLNGDVTANQVRSNVTRSTFGFPQNLYIWYEYRQDSLIESAVGRLMMNGVSVAYNAEIGGTFASEYYARHSRLVVIVDNNWESSYVLQWGFRPSILTNQLLTASWQERISGGFREHSLDSYLIYCSGGVSYFYLGLPVA